MDFYSTELQTSKQALEKSRETFWRVVNAILAHFGERPTLLVKFPMKGTPMIMASSIMAHRATRDAEKRAERAKEI